MILITRSHSHTQVHGDDDRFVLSTIDYSSRHGRYNVAINHTFNHARASHYWHDTWYFVRMHVTSSQTDYMTSPMRYASFFLLLDIIRTSNDDGAIVKPGTSVQFRKSWPSGGSMSKFCNRPAMKRKISWRASNSPRQDLLPGVSTNIRQCYTHGLHWNTETSGGARVLGARDKGMFGAPPLPSPPLPLLYTVIEPTFCKTNSYKVGYTSLSPYTMGNMHYMLSYKYCLDVWVCKLILLPRREAIVQWACNRLNQSSGHYGSAFSLAEGWCTMMWKIAVLAIRVHTAWEFERDCYTYDSTCSPPWSTTSRTAPQAQESKQVARGFNVRRSMWSTENPGHNNTQRICIIVRI